MPPRSESAGESDPGRSNAPLGGYPICFWLLRFVWDLFLLLFIMRIIVRLALKALCVVACGGVGAQALMAAGDSCQVLVNPTDSYRWHILTGNREMLRVGMAGWGPNGRGQALRPIRKGPMRGLSPRAGWSSTKS